MATSEVSGNDTVTEPGDSSGGSVTAYRTGDDDAGLTEEARGEVGGIRSVSDAASATDVTSSYTIRPRVGVEVVGALADVATWIISKIYSRTAEDHLPIPYDQAKHFTRLAGFAQPGTAQPLLKRVIFDNPRAYTVQAQTWSADVPISIPVPYERERPVLKDFGGFGFTTGGICVNVSEADVEEAFSPFFAPPVMP